MAGNKRAYGGAPTGKGKRKYTTVLGYDRAAGGLTASSRQKQALTRLIAASKETGYVDLALAGYPLDTTGSVTLLNTVPQGTAVTQRVGKKILMKGLQVRGISQNGTTATTNDCAYCIVYDKRPTGALPSVTDILVSVSSFAMNNDNNSGRFSILKREDFVLLGNSAAAANQTDLMARGEDWWLDLKKREVVYKAAGTGAIADIEQGALYLVTVGNTVAGTGAATAFLGFRLRFFDA